MLVFSVLNNENKVLKTAMVPTDEWKYQAPILEDIFAYVKQKDQIKVIHTDHVFRFQAAIRASYGEMINQMESEGIQFQQVKGDHLPIITQDIWHAKRRIWMHMAQRHADCPAAKNELSRIFSQIKSKKLLDKAKAKYPNSSGED